MTNIHMSEGRTGSDQYTLLTSARRFSDAAYIEKSPINLTLLSIRRFGAPFIPSLLDMLWVLLT